MGIFSELNKLESESKEQSGHPASATLEIGDFDIFSVAKKQRLCFLADVKWVLLFYGIDHQRTLNSRIHYLNPCILIITVQTNVW